MSCKQNIKAPVEDCFTIATRHQFGRCRPKSHHAVKVSLCLYQLNINFVWRKHDNMFPCTGSGVIASYERIAPCVCIRFRLWASEFQGNSANRPLRWRHNGCDSVSNHQPHYCLLNRLFRRRSKKTSKLRVTGLCAGNSPETGEFPAQMASYAENVSIWWRHHAS